MIQVKNMFKNYVVGDTKVEALKDININFRDNEFVSILGPSGCGKTTFLNALGGLDRYDEGEIKINGKSTKNFNDKDWDAYRNHYIGFIFQSYNLIPHLSVLENVEIALTIAGVNKKDKKERALKALEKVGLTNQITKKPNQLSGGQMQRVAIARAIVNNPKIILADEPTGALDSETSVQIMELLKEIAGDHLIIMVTHNKDLADKYSNRIVSLLDGKIIDDTNEYKVDDNIESVLFEETVLNKQPTKTEENKIKETKENTKNLTKEVSKKPKKIKPKKSSMSFWTAIKLSFKNLFSKKGRTFMISFAGSIGIIGIALVLAVSNGFNGYVNNLQKDALQNYPITVSTVAMDWNKFTGFKPNQTTPNSQTNQNALIPYVEFQQFIEFGHYNNIDTNFVSAVKKFESEHTGKKSIGTIDYKYHAPVKMITKTSENKYAYLERNNATSVMYGGIKSDVYPMMNDMDYALNGYNLVYGKMPQKYPGDPFTKEMLLVVGKNNRVEVGTLLKLGLAEQENVTLITEIPFEEICNKEYKLLFNDDYYVPSSKNFNEITSFSKAFNKGKLSTVEEQEKLKNSYNSLTTTLKISGIISPGENASSVLPIGLCYMPDMEEYYLNNCKESVIGRKQLEKNEEMTFFDNYVLKVSEMPPNLVPKGGFKSAQEINDFMKNKLGYNVDNKSLYQLGLQQIGISTTPVEISIYANKFDSKEEIISMIKSYNKTQINDTSKIVYTDMSEVMANTMNNMVNMISYVLIAFASISLVVSSIMISIITYVSVIERTKEIGVLRSLGARKKDVSRVFNAETLIIGLSAGLLGVFVSFVLTFPISAIIKSVSNGAVTTSMAVMPPVGAVILVCVSVVLTLLAGFIPSRIAAKKDPVKALKAE